ncbi:RodZ domain-containing protein [Nonomuraea sp. NPDC048916]|uniref:helix-turn-helix domain-containing protein n=1 Tax=Nonomuraea sp. NPDC048916 TaxID=3154232 RepID=UPI0033D2A63F
MEEQSIGAILAAARQSAGMTVAQLSAITRIREAIIYAIERDDYAQCGGDFYERGHIKVLAKAVGLDPDAMVHLYDEQHGGGLVPVRAATVFQTDRKLRIRERRAPNWTMALGVALAIVVVFGVVRVLGGATDQHTVGTQPMSASPSVPPNSPIHEPPRGGSALAGRAGENEVVVKIKAERSSFLNVRDSRGRKLFSGTLPAGKSSTWRAASQVSLLIGDAGAVALQVNGQDLGHPGQSGEIVRRSFGPPTAPRR